MGCTSSSGSADLVANLTQEHQNEDVFEDYTEVNQLGLGSIGSVSTVTKRKGADKSTLYALKTIMLSQLNEASLRELHNEVSILKQLDHPNIVRAVETYRCRERMYIVMDLCTGGDLYRRLPYSPQQAVKIVDKICSAVAYMHQKKIIHRDLKFENILFESKNDDSEIKIIDFGLSTQYSCASMHKVVGTAYTMAPEVIQGNYTEKADLWSVGVITYMLLGGVMPFKGNNMKQLSHSILNRPLDFTPKRFKRVPEPAKDFIEHLIERNQHRRWSAAKALNSEWLVSGREEVEQELERASDCPSCERISSIECLADTIEAFGESQKLKKLALMLIARKATTQEIMEMRRLFNQIDTDHTGIITIGEFQQALQEAGYQTDESSAIFNAADVRSTGQIEYTEFIAATLSAQGHVREEQLREAFDQLDEDNTGLITRKNLRTVLGTEYNKSEVDDLISETDRTGNGAISYREFIALFYKGRSILKLDEETGAQVLTHSPSAERQKLPHSANEETKDEQKAPQAEDAAASAPPPKVAPSPSPVSVPAEPAAPAAPATSTFALDEAPAFAPSPAPVLAPAEPAPPAAPANSAPAPEEAPIPLLDAAQPEPPSAS